MTENLESGLREIRLEDLPDLIAGVSLLGSGGGGLPKPIAGLLARALEKNSVEVRSLASMPDSSKITAVGIVGSTSFLLEKLPSGSEISDVVAGLTRWSGTVTDALMGIEGGGVNGLSSLLSAVTLGLPFIDADLMGRALPRTDQFSLVVSGVPVTPIVLASPDGQIVVLDNLAAHNVEDAIRASISRASGWAQVAVGPFPASILRPAVVTGTLQRALALGKAFRSSALGDPAGLAEALGGQSWAQGRVLQVHRQVAVGGFGRGSLVIQDRRSAAIVRVEMENEYLAVLRDGEMVATCPDLVVIIDYRIGLFLDSESIREGAEVIVLSLPGPQWWTRTPERLAVVGPKAFGIEHDPVLAAMQ